MPIQDAKLQYSDGQVINTTEDSTDSVDLGAGKDFAFNANTQDHGVQGNMWLNIVVTTAFVGGTSVAFELQDSADDSSFAALTAPKSPITVAATAVATLVAGFLVLRVPLPPTIRRFTKIVYTVVGSPSAGAVDAWVGPAGQA